MFALTRLLALPALAFALAMPNLAPARAETAPAIMETTVVASTLDAKKRTQVGLYLTAAEAQALLAARDDLVLIDVRTPEETMVVGYPDAADANIPLMLFDPTHHFDAEKGHYALVPNSAFATTAKAFLAERAPAAALIICRSGDRSSKAVDALTAAGVDLPLYSVIDGVEGDKDATGKRTLNGWKNAGAPWGYTLRPDFLRSGS